MTEGIPPAAVGVLPTGGYSSIPLVVIEEIMTGSSFVDFEGITR